MRFILTVDLDQLPQDRPKELGRILRYWGGNLTDELLAEGTTQEIYDSTYSPVGAWQVDGAGRRSARARRK